MNAFEQAQANTLGLMEEVRDALGKPQAGLAPATGIYAFIEAVSIRLTWFERYRERAIGALTVGLPLVCTMGALLWFFGGDKITKLFN